MSEIMLTKEGSLGLVSMNGQITDRDEPSVFVSLPIDPSLIAEDAKLASADKDENPPSEEKSSTNGDGIRPTDITVESKQGNADKASLLLAISKLAKDIQAFSQSGLADKTARYDIRTAVLALSNGIEDPVDQAIRIVYETSPPTVALRVALEGGFLAPLSGQEVKTAAQLSAESGANQALIARVMRVLTASKMVEEVGQNSYVANALTQAFLQPGVSDAIKHSWDNVNLVFSKLTEFLSNTSFQEPDSYILGPHTFAFGRPLWKRLELEPRRSKVFDQFMMAFKKNRDNWVDIFPFNPEAEKLGPDQVLIVDVAGGIGHRVKDFKNKYPQASGRALLQDLAHVIPSMDSNPEVLAGLKGCGVEVMEYNYSKVQPIYGARYYFFSAIFHGKPDGACLDLLLNTTPAMKKGYSRILINDFVLPDTNASLFQASMDLWMMAEVSGKERTRQDWATLLAAAKLQIVEIHRLGTDSVIEIELAE